MDNKYDNILVASQSMESTNLAWSDTFQNSDNLIDIMKLSEKMAYIVNNIGCVIVLLHMKV